MGVVPAPRCLCMPLHLARLSCTGDLHVPVLSSHGTGTAGLCHHTRTVSSLRPHRSGRTDSTQQTSSIPEAGGVWSGAVAACTMPFAASLAGAYSRPSMNCTGPSIRVLECRHMLVDTPPGSTAHACVRPAMLGVCSGGCRQDTLLCRCGREGVKATGHILSACLQRGRQRWTPQLAWNALWACCLIRDMATQRLEVSMPQVGSTIQLFTHSRLSSRAAPQCQSLATDGTARR